MDLRERFFALWTRLGAKGNPEKVFDRLVQRYSEPHRFYHNRQHWEFGIKQFNLLSELAEHPDFVEFAWAFHDSVYAIGATNNEEQSCRLAVETLRQAKVHGGVQVHVGSLIMATKHDQIPSNMDQKIMVDIDLAILGQEPEIFGDYERRVRVEYESVDEKVFWKARKGILQGFLDRERIYYTDLFQDIYEDQARENLLRTITAH